jgi:hypothetical protein
MASSSVIVNYLHVLGTPRRPVKTYAVLIVYADTELSVAPPLQGLQPVSGGNPEIIKTFRDLKLAQLAQGNSFNTSKTSYSPTLEQIPRLFALKGGNHALLITPNVHNVKRE